jgi:hypothetical protein
VVVRPAVDEDWPKAEPLLRAFGGVLRGVAARIGAMARSSSDCLLVADAGGDLIGYAGPQDLGAQMRQAETTRLCEASAIAVGIAPNDRGQRASRGVMLERRPRSTGLALYENRSVAANESSQGRHPRTRVSFRCATSLMWPKGTDAV